MKVAYGFGVLLALNLQVSAEQTANPASLQPPSIKSYCLDFNWAPTSRRNRPFASPGQWADADPASHVRWYKSIGANVIQTFCVSTNGYAWYKNGFVPEQPKLKHDFLPEMVKLGHAEGMKVMGYFCASANPRWAELHPEQSYGSPTTYHIPYTDDYLAYLSQSISDAVKRTGIDGFMVDWLWMPNRSATQGKWLDCEKKLYEQLTGKPFPGEQAMGEKSPEELAYSRKALERCWQAIRKAAKEANPDCIIWLTVNHFHHPHVMDSAMYREADWLMNEAGNLSQIEQVRSMVGKDTRLITCMAAWNGQDAAEAVPASLKAGVGLYGFTTPRGKGGVEALDGIFSRQVSELSGDQRSIAVLSRIYHGNTVHSLWQNGAFVEPAQPPAFNISLNGRGRGSQDTAVLAVDADSSTVTITTPYAKGAGRLKLIGQEWPKTLCIRLQKQAGEASAATMFKLGNGSSGMEAALDGSTEAAIGKLSGRNAQTFLSGEPSSHLKVVSRSGEWLEVRVPEALLRDKPAILSFEWQ